MELLSNWSPTSLTEIVIEEVDWARVYTGSKAFAVRGLKNWRMAAMIEQK